jgi:hypothetical protein
MDIFASIGNVGPKRQFQNERLICGVFERSVTLGRKGYLFIFAQANSSLVSTPVVSEDDRKTVSRFWWAFRGQLRPKTQNVEFSASLLESFQQVKRDDVGG